MENKIKKIIFYKDNIIIDCIETTSEIENIKKIYIDCQYKEVALGSEYSKDTNILHFDKAGKKYKNKELIEKKLITLKDDEKLNEETDLIEKLTEIEMIEAKLKELDKTKKIIMLDDGTKQITQKTFDELKTENLLTDEEILNHEKQKATARLNQIDIESIRPLRAVTENTATDFDLKKLHDLDAEAAELRAILAK